MSKALTEIAKRPGRLPALVAALGILLWSTVLAVVGWLFALIVDPGSIGTLSYVVLDVLSRALPFSVGVFVALWAIAPISHELTLRFVLTRAALAAACGVVLVDLVTIVVSFFGSIRHLNVDLQGFLHTSVNLLADLIPFLLNSLALVMLACVLLWLWLRDHPRKYAVAGLIDDV